LPEHRGVQGGAAKRLLIFNPRTRGKGLDQGVAVARDRL
jgi:hypothetical protein